jgi:hypothetical protein
MHANEHLEALAAAAARLQAQGVRILEVRYEQPNCWSMAVQRGEARLALEWDGEADRILSISRLRRSIPGVEYWDKPELVSVADDGDSLQRLMLRAEREIVARLKDA